MKKWLILIVLAVCLFPSLGFAAPSPAASATPSPSASQNASGDAVFEAELRDTLFKTDLSGLEGKYNEYLKSLSGQDAQGMVYALSNGDFSSLSPGTVLAAVFGQILSGVRENIPVMVQILVILLVMSVLTQLNSNLGGGQSVSGAARYVGYIIVCGLIISIVVNIFNSGRDVVQAVSSFTEYLTPVLFTLLNAIGGFTSASILKPAVTAFTGGIAQVIILYVFPALIINMVFVFIGNLSSNLNLKGFSSLVESLIKWSLGIISIVFLGLVVIQGVGAGLFDGISIRTAKYTIDRTVPVVGGMFSESVDTVVACSALVKNAVGITGLVTIIAILAAPMVNMVINIFLLKILSAVCAPFSDERSVEMLNGTTSVITLLLVTVMTIGIMAFILVAILMGVGNINMMMR